MQYQLFYFHSNQQIQYNRTSLTQQLNDQWFYTSVNALKGNSNKCAIDRIFCFFVALMHISFFMDIRWKSQSKIQIRETVPNQHKCAFLKSSDVFFHGENCIEAFVKSKKMCSLNSRGTEISVDLILLSVRFSWQCTFQL